jgi:hypothetical protein
VEDRLGAAACAAARRRAWTGTALLATQLNAEWHAVYVKRSAALAVRLAQAILVAEAGADLARRHRKRYWRSLIMQGHNLPKIVLSWSST